MSNPKPLRMQMRVKNNRMIRAREEMGYDTVAGFCRAVGIAKQHSLVGSYENFKTSPIRVARELVYVCIAPGCEDSVTDPRRVTCKAHKPSQEDFLKDPAVTATLPHVWTTPALRIAGLLFREPEWLWPEEVREVKNAVAMSVELEVSEAKLLSQAADGDFSAMELKGRIAEVLDVLSDRERDIITRRFGLEAKTSNRWSR